MSLKEQSIKAVIWIGATKVFAQSTSWVVTIILARLLSPVDFGLMAMAAIFIAFAELINDLGIGVAIVQRNTLNQEQLHTTFWFSLFLGTVLFLTLHSAAPLAASLLRNPQLTAVLKVLSFTFLIDSLKTVPLNLLRRDLLFKRISKMRLTSDLIGAVSSVGLALSGHGVWSLVIGFMIRSVLFTLLVLLVSRWKPRLLFSFQTVTDFIGFGLTVTTTRFLWYLNQNFDYFLVGRVLGDGILGFYRVAFILGRTPLKKVWLLINQVTVPVLSKLQEDTERLKNYFLSINRYIAMIVIPGNIGAFLLSHDFVLFILKEKWLPILFPFRVFLIVSILECATISIAPVLIAKGKPHLNLKVALINVSLFVPGLLLGITFGLAGVLLAWVCVFPIICILKVDYVLKELDLSLWHYLRNLSLPVFGTVFMTLTLCSARFFIADHLTLGPRLLTLSFIGIVAYLMFLSTYPSNLKQEIRDVVGVILPTKGMTASSSQ